MSKRHWSRWSASRGCCPPAKDEPEPIPEPPAIAFARAYWRQDNPLDPSPEFNTIFWNLDPVVGAAGKPNEPGQFDVPDRTAQSGYWMFAVNLDQGTQIARAEVVLDQAESRGVTISMTCELPLEDPVRPGHSAYESHWTEWYDAQIFPPPALPDPQQRCLWGDQWVRVMMRFEATDDATTYRDNVRASGIDSAPRTDAGTLLEVRNADNHYGDNATLRNDWSLPGGTLDPEFYPEWVLGDVTASLQEVLDRPGFANGNSVLLFLDEEGGTDVVDDIPGEPYGRSLGFAALKNRLGQLPVQLRIWLPA